AQHISHCTWAAPALAELNGRPLMFFCGGNGVVYAFEPVENGVMESWSNGVVTRSGSIQHSNTPALQSPKHLQKVWQFDFDPTAPKTEVHKYNTNRREGPSNIYGMPVFWHNRIYVA